MSNSKKVLERRSRVLINTDPQKRCYNGAYFSTELAWGRWEALHYFNPADDFREMCRPTQFWEELNAEAVADRGEGARREYRVRTIEAENNLSTIFP